MDKLPLVLVGAPAVLVLSVAGRASALHLHSGLLWVGAGSRGRIEVWAADGARRVGVLDGHGGNVTGIAVDAEGCVVSSSVSSKRGHRVLWHSRAPARLG